MSVTEAMPGEERGPEQFVARLPHIEEQIGELVTGPYATWSPMPEKAHDSVLGVVHVQTFYRGRTGTMALSAWFGRDDAGDVVGGYGLYTPRRDIGVSWGAGNTDPAALRVYDSADPDMLFPPDFVAVHALADRLADGVEPISLPPRSLFARAAEYLAAHHAVFGVPPDARQ